MGPLTCTVTASFERWMVPLKLRAEAFAFEYVPLPLVTVIVPENDAVEPVT
jgi:hypothetical protein